VAIATAFTIFALAVVQSMTLTNLIVVKFAAIFGLTILAMIGLYN
jgi:hypothetical protein